MHWFHDRLRLSLHQFLMIPSANCWPFLKRRIVCNLKVEVRWEIKIKLVSCASFLLNSLQKIGLSNGISRADVASSRMRKELDKLPDKRFLPTLRNYGHPLDLCVSAIILFTDKVLWPWAISKPARVLVRDRFSILKSQIERIVPFKKFNFFEGHRLPRTAIGPDPESYVQPG